MPKRKAADSENTSNKKSKLADTDSTSRPVKKATTTRKAKGKKAPGPEEPTKPTRKRINKALKNKVNEVKNFVDSTSPEDSRLKRRDGNENHVIVTEACLLGSLMAMHVDWELTDPRMASLLEVSEAVVEQFEEKWVTGDGMVRMVVVDLEVETAFVEGIQQKIEGWDLEGINLLEVEMELYLKEAEEIASLRLFSAFESSDQASEGDDETPNDSSITEKDAETSSPSSQTTQESEADTSATTTNLTPEKESGHKGVCPAPMKQL